jgi:thioredoxin reductase (NADPH)
MANRAFYDLIIVGGGPAGITAGIYSLRASMRTLLIEKAVPGGQVNQSDAVENYPGFKNIGGFDLSRSFLEYVQDYHLELLNEEVVAVEPGLASHTVRVENGNSLKSHAVILAAGGTPRMLDIPGEKEFYGKGVSYCAVCDGFFSGTRASWSWAAGIRRWKRPFICRSWPARSIWCIVVTNCAPA